MPCGYLVLRSTMLEHTRACIKINMAKPGSQRCFSWMALSQENVSVQPEGWDELGGLGSGYRVVGFD